MEREQPDERLKGINIEAPCVCGNAPTCVGNYEGAGIATGCGSCCGHGSEDGWCVSVEEERHKRELATARAEGYAQAREQAHLIAYERCVFVRIPALGHDIAERIRAMQPEETK